MTTDKNTIQIAKRTRKKTRDDLSPELLARLAVPEFFVGGIGGSRQVGSLRKDHLLQVSELVSTVLADDHPGDDCFPPRWLLRFCDDTFSAAKLRSRLTESGSVDLLTVARDCVTAYDDDLLSWSTIVAAELEDRGLPGFMMDTNQGCGGRLPRGPPGLRYEATRSRHHHHVGERRRYNGNNKQRRHRRRERQQHHEEFGKHD